MHITAAEMCTLPICIMLTRPVPSISLQRTRGLPLQHPWLKAGLMVLLRAVEGVRAVWVPTGGAATILGVCDVQQMLGAEGVRGDPAVAAMDHFSRHLGSSERMRELSGGCQELQRVHMTRLGIHIIA